MALPLRAATVWWTGGGDGTTWEDADNWSSGEVPDIQDVVLLGYSDEGNVSDVAQTIQVTGDKMVAQIQIYAEGNRAVTLNGGTFLLASNNAPDTSNTVILHDTAASPVVINSNLQINRRRAILNNSNIELQIGGSITPTPEYIPGSEPPEKFPGWNPGGWEFRYGIQNGQKVGPIVYNGSGAQVIDQAVARTEATLYFDNPNLTTSQLVAEADIDLYFSQIGGFGGTAAGAGTEVKIYRMGTEDVVVATTSSGQIAGSSGGVVRLMPGDPGQGHLYYELGRLGSGDTTNGIGAGSALVTAADTTVVIRTFNIATRRVISAAENERISGEGNVMLSMSNAAEVFYVYGVLTYTGRTMLEKGIFRMMSAGDEDWQKGTLSAASVVEIGSTAKLDLNGVSQTVAGISDYNSTSGEVAFGGATLTIQSAGSTSFGGQFTGGGTVVKAGEGTFTVTGTNNYNGAISVTEGTFRLDGSLTSVSGVNVSGGLFEVNGSVTSSPVTVSSGGTLGGSGSLGGTVSIGSGGILAPGNSPGTLNISGDLEFASGAVVYFEIGSGGNDLIVLDGVGQTISTGGELVWYFIPNGMINVGTTYQLIDWSAAIDLDTWDFLISDLVVGNPGMLAAFGLNENGVTVTFGAIPEPAHVAALLGAAFLLFAIVPRRRASR